MPDRARGDPVGLPHHLRPGADTARLEATNRYMVPNAGSLALDLARLGVDVPDAGRFDALARAFLCGSLGKVTAGDQAMLAAMLDPVHLAVPASRRPGNAAS